MSHSIRQQMQKSLYQTADTGLYLKTVDAGLSPPDSESRSHCLYIRQQLQENQKRVQISLL